MNQELIINVLIAIVIYKLIVSWIGGQILKLIFGVLVKDPKISEGIKKSFKAKMNDKLKEE